MIPAPSFRGAAQQRARNPEPISLHDEARRLRSVLARLRFWIPGSPLRGAPERRVRTAVVAALMLVASVPALAQPRPVPATCTRDLFQNEAAMRQRQYKMQQVATADQATQCAAWRDHVAFMQKARAVFATCQTGREREQNVAQMDESLADYRVLLANRCGRR
jgi:hypothetical protein